ncbi:MAG: 50S ribosomal protein L23 [Ktedonobacterales bacterium]|nr:50S ribosomal protein L23 [Ktedonobacterales bacterium]
MELTEVIRRGIVTEKTVAMQQPAANQVKRQAVLQERERQGQDVKMIDLTHKYVFEVALHATKIQIRQAAELLFPDITVLSVNTMRIPGKAKSIRTRKGVRRTPARPWKKAIITVRADETISMLQP